MKIKTLLGAILLEKPLRGVWGRTLDSVHTMAEKESPASQASQPDQPGQPDHLPGLAPTPGAQNHKIWDRGKFFLTGKQCF